MATPLFTYTKTPYVLLDAQRIIGTSQVTLGPRNYYDYDFSNFRELKFQVKWITSSQNSFTFQAGNSGTFANGTLDASSTALQAPTANSLSTINATMFYNAATGIVDAEIIVNCPDFKTNTTEIQFRSTTTTSTGVVLNKLNNSLGTTEREGHFAAKSTNGLPFDTFRFSGPTVTTGTIYMYGLR
jgi:hypothetical protein